MGLASLAGLLFGLTVAAYSMAIVYSERYPTWLGWLGLLASVGTLAAAVAQAYTRFSGLAMALSMPARALLLVWLALVGACLWRGPAPAL